MAKKKNELVTKGKKRITKTKTKKKQRRRTTTTTKKEKEEEEKEIKLITKEKEKRESPVLITSSGVSVTTLRRPHQKEKKIISKWASKFNGSQTLLKTVVQEDNRPPQITERHYSNRNLLNTMNQSLLPEQTNKLTNYYPTVTIRHPPKKKSPPPKKLKQTNLFFDKSKYHASL